jgi:hypothetical protein
MGNNNTIPWYETRCGFFCTKCVINDTTTQWHKECTLENYLASNLFVIYTEISDGKSRNCEKISSLATVFGRLTGHKPKSTSNRKINQQGWMRQVNSILIPNRLFHCFFVRFEYPYTCQIWRRCKDTLRCFTQRRYSTWHAMVLGQDMRPKSRTCWPK